METACVRIIPVVWPRPLRDCCVCLVFGCFDRRREDPVEIVFELVLDVCLDRTDLLFEGLVKLGKCINRCRIYNPSDVRIRVTEKKGEGLQQ